MVGSRFRVVSLSYTSVNSQTTSREFGNFSVCQGIFLESTVKIYCLGELSAFQN